MVEFFHDSPDCLPKLIIKLFHQVMMNVDVICLLLLISHSQIPFLTSAKHKGMVYLHHNSPRPLPPHDTIDMLGLWGG
jgi:hypothetical protein